MATGKGGGRKANRQTATSPRRSVSGRQSRSSPPVVTLLTDFGTTDHFVAAMKGVILGANSRIQIVDITHDIPPQDIGAAAFSLFATYESFPPKTIHVAVVDPEVGSKRLPLVIEAAGQVFVGPNNGVFSYICDQNAFRARAITEQSSFRHPVSPTFHGRDVFAPVAAAIANGTEIRSFGPEIDNLVRLKPLGAVRLPNGELKGRVIHIDRFGNCITNFTKADFPKFDKSSLLINRKQINSLRGFFADETGDAGKVFAYWGSAGFLELGVRNASAAKVLKVKVGDSVMARLRS